MIYVVRIFSVLIVLLTSFSICQAGGEVSTCKFQGYGDFQAIDTEGDKLNFTIKPNGITVKSSYADLNTSKNPAYETGTFTHKSKIYNDIDSFFGPMYSDMVKSINRQACALYSISTKHELYVVEKNAPERQFLVLEYSAVDPPAVYALIRR